MDDICECTRCVYGMPDCGKVTCTNNMSEEYGKFVEADGVCEEYERNEKYNETEN